MQWIQDAASSLASAFGYDDENQNVEKDDTRSGPQVATASAPLQRGTMLSKEHLKRFFDACSNQLEKPAVKQRLKEAHEEGEDVDDLITEMQREVFERQGVDGMWGIVCLGRINTEHKNDANLIAAFYQFIMLEEAALDEATMPSDAFQEKAKTMAQLQRQQEALKARMEGLPPSQRQRFLQSQQVLLTQLQQQQSMMGEKMLSMSQQERAAFIQQQMSGLDGQLQKAAHQATLNDTEGLPDGGNVMEMKNCSRN